VKKLLIFVLILFLPLSFLFSLEKKNDFWISAGADIAMYSYLGAAFGGSISIGYGTGTTIGFKAALFFNEEKIDTLELCFLLRFYLMGSSAYSGPFLQILGGPALFNRTGNFAIPSSAGMISAGGAFGWRFLINDMWFIEPQIRGGYPYLFGAGISGGIRF